MFTGLVEHLGRLVEVRSTPSGRLLRVDAGELARSAEIGDSIAIDGCCLTVVELAGSLAAFQAGPETLARTTLGERKAGDTVNLERALRADGRLGGHIVQGHVDGVGQLRSRTPQDEWETLWFTAGDVARDLVSKGSVAVDGISLTVVDVTDDAFSVALIPHTLKSTTLGNKREGENVNLESDILGKYVRKYIGAISSSLSDGLTREKLLDAGFLRGS